jgi:hypothetical protein
MLSKSAADNAPSALTSLVNFDKAEGLTLALCRAFITSCVLNKFSEPWMLVLGYKALPYVEAVAGVLRPDEAAPVNTPARRDSDAAGVLLVVDSIFKSFSLLHLKNEYKA